MAKRNEPTPCTECNKTLTTTKYCEPCRRVVKNRQYRERNTETRQRESDTKKKQRAYAESNNGKHKPVNPYFLVRGTVSGGNRECNISCQA